MLLEGRGHEIEETGGADPPVLGSVSGRDEQDGLWIDTEGALGLFAARCPGRGPKRLWYNRRARRVKAPTRRGHAPPAVAHVHDDVRHAQPEPEDVVAMV